MNVSQMINYWGYPSEEYEVITEDGYILGVFRIPYGKKNSENLAPKAVVYLQHGLVASASNWICNLPNNSLAFLLADSGYDVWLGNSRGNTWSRKHLRLSPKSPQYWAFSLDEMAKYDLPATINLILEKSGQKQLFYVGHSQGTTIAFIAFSTNPELAKKIKVFFALAPVVTVKYTRSPMKKLTALSRQAVKHMFGTKGFFLEDKKAKACYIKVCNEKLLRPLCSEFMSLWAGFNKKNMNMSRANVYVAHSPAGTSVQNILHWSQAVNSGELRAFDWGSETKNLEKCNQPTPIRYKVRDMTVPTAMWTGGQDWLSNPDDVQTLLSEVTNLIYHKNIPEWAHVDFIWGLDAPHRVYNEIIHLMKWEPSLSQGACKVTL
ncbi:Lipase member M [Lemmus lemmus]